MFIFEKVGHSRFVEMHGDTSDFFRSASKSDRYFLNVSPNYMSHAMMTQQVFVISLITILVVMMMRRRWTVMIWNILRMLLTI